MKKTNILFVCLGNICRSASAEGIMKKLLEDKGLSDKFFVDSAGILSMHKGNRADSRMRAAAAAHGYDLQSLSRPVEFDDFEKFDYIIAMDNSNVDDLYDRAPNVESTKKITKMTDYCTNHSDDYVPDPYYGGAEGFEYVIELLEDACEGLIQFLMLNS